MTVSFIGNPEESSDAIIIYRLKDEIEKLIQKGAKTFLYKGWEPFDYIAALSTIEAKEKHQHIRCECFISSVHNRYNKIIHNNIEKMPESIPYYMLNKQIIDKSDIVICYVWHNMDNAHKLVEYAKEKNKIVIQIN